VPIICLEGPSAAGKTTLARSLHALHGAAVVPELDASEAPPPARAEPWFSDRHAERWQEALTLARTAPFAVIDCDPLKGLWYNWMHAAKGWPGVDVVEPQYRSRMERGALGVPDLYVYLHATEAQLRQRRAADPTRQRRGFEKNVRTAVAQRRYFTALGAADPGRVVFVDTSSQSLLADQVMTLVSAAPGGATDPLALLATMASWIRAHDAEEAMR
jgi:hypothetical protein